ncbi:hypothetical protein GALL_515780 [mine drainage metagenome]|uniref:Uncharacterized protein n=1 Tax=mine drainage metagenome TaxID=410659 RepID=A0A1J5P6L3_9ZZZZ
MACVLASRCSGRKPPMDTPVQLFAHHRREHVHYRVHWRVTSRPRNLIVLRDVWRERSNRRAAHQYLAHVATSPVIGLALPPAASPCIHATLVQVLSNSINAVARICSFEYLADDCLPVRQQLVGLALITPNDPSRCLPRIRLAVHAVRNKLLLLSRLGVPNQLRLAHVLLVGSDLLKDNHHHGIRIVIQPLPRIDLAVGQGDDDYSRQDQPREQRRCLQHMIPGEPVDVLNKQIASRHDVATLHRAQEPPKRACGRILPSECRHTRVGHL